MSDKNLRNCKACNKQIARGVKKCPHCGKDQRNFFMRHKILTVIIIFLLLGIFSPTEEDEEVKVADDSKVVEEATAEDVTDNKEEVKEATEVKEDIKEKVKKEVKEEKQTEFKVNEVISYKNFDLVFENQRNIDGIVGDSYLVLDAKITSKKDGLNFFGDIQGVTNDNEVVDSTLAFVENIGDPMMTVWTKTLNDGQKASGYVAFDREVEKIEVRSNYFSNDLITIVLD